MANVTVLVPMYNVEKYVSKCLDSLISQTYKDIEIWAVNDGSPDNSRNIVLDYAAKDSRVKLIDKENGGYGSVLQMGIKKIKSPYFLVCDPDDWLEPTAIEKLYNFSLKSNLDLAVGDYYDVFVGDKNKHVVHFIKNITPHKVDTEEKDIQRFSFGAVSPHAKLFRTSIVKNIDLPMRVNYTDFILYIYALTNAKRVSYIDIPLANYLKDRPNNSVTNVNPSRLKDHAMVWNGAFNQIPIKKENSVILQRLYEAVLGNLIVYSLYSTDYFHDKYWKYILDTVREVRKAAPILKSNFNGSIVNKIIMNGLLNEKSYIRYSRNYVLYVSKKNKLRKTIKKIRSKS